MAKIGWKSAAALVIANMIGTGAFTTLGIQLELVSNGWVIIITWLVGGLVALFGAISYAELGVRLPKSGGEAHFLSEIYHPILGFLSGWVSLSVGFAAAVALAAVAVGKYTYTLTGWPPVWVAVGSIVLLSLLHGYSMRQGSRVQNFLTVLKLILVAALAVLGFLLPASTSSTLDWSFQGTKQIFSAGTAVSLVLVFYAYSGWNAAAYIVGEIKQPSKNLPKALIGGSLLVSGLFIMLQLSFLRQAGPAELSGRVEVGQIAAQQMLGLQAGQLISALIGVLLLAGISAMIWVGPRVLESMGKQYEPWRILAKRSKRGLPIRAIWLQSSISIFLVLTASFEGILYYSGFVLQLFTMLAVYGLIRLRIRQPKAAWVSPLFPIAQWLYLAFSAYALIYVTAVIYHIGL
ncbi:MAG: amino acid permease [Bacteroidota bacterium]